MTVFLCQNGFDGILCGVYDVYASRLALSDCRLEMAEEYEPALFADYREVLPEAWKAKRVADKIKSFMSEEAYVYLYRAALHRSPDRADWILRFVSLGLAHGRRTLRMLQRPEVFEIFQMNRYVGNEAHFLVEFMRFERLPAGVYYGKVGPENQVLELVAAHFADRFPDMDWLIYDERHREAAIHSASGQWVMKRQVTEAEISAWKGTSEADAYTGMWKTFFETIAIEERRNPRCQRNMLPLRYRKYMTEFQQH